MIQHDFVRQRKRRFLLLFLSRKPGHAAVHIALHMIRQVLIQIIQTRLRVSDLRQISVDAVGGRHHPHRRRRKGHKLGHQHGDIAVLQDINKNKGQHRGNKHSLDQQPRRIVHHRIVSRHIGPDRTALIIIAHKELFPVQHLHILQAVNRLDSPLGNP